MDLENFSLAWRWTKSSHAKLPNEALDELRPLTIESAQKIAASSPINFPPGATRLDSSVDDELTRQWLRKIPISTQRVTISWDQYTALNLPWSIFCEYWDDFCYPSVDDADFFLENGRLFLRWNHFEVFEHDSSAL